MGCGLPWKLVLLQWHNFYFCVVFKVKQIRQWVVKECVELEKGIAFLEQFNNRGGKFCCLFHQKQHHNLQVVSWRSQKLPISVAVNIQRHKEEDTDYEMNRMIYDIRKWSSCLTHYFSSFLRPQIDETNLITLS